MGDISKKKHRKITRCPAVYCWKQRCVYGRNEALKVPSIERRRREDRGAEGERFLGSGCPPPQPTTGSGRASWAPPAGSGAEPRPPTYPRHISAPQKPSSRRLLKFWGPEICLVETMHYGVYGIISVFIWSKQLQWLRSLRELQLGATRIGLNMTLSTYRIRQVELEVNTNIMLNKKSSNLAKFYNFAKKLVRPWPDRFRRPWPIIY